LLNSRNGVATGTHGCDSAASASYSSSAITGTYPCYSSFTQGFGNPVYEISTMDTGVFAQDNWKFTSRLTLEIGLRWDYESLPGPSSNLTAVNATSGAFFYAYPGLTNNPTDKRNFGPRFGFSYDVGGKGNTVIRGGYGVYYGRITNGNLLNLRLNTGSANGQYTSTWNANTAGAPQFPNVLTTGGAAKPASYFLAPGMRNPTVQEFDVMIQHNLGKGNFLQLSYLGALGRELPNYLNLNLNPATVTNKTFTVSDATGKGPLPNGTSFTVPTYTSYGNTALFGPNAANFQAITEEIGNINSNYNGFVIEVLNRSLKAVQFDANYTWSHALDFAQNANTTGATNNWYDPFSHPRANYANSNFNVPNRFVGYVLYNTPNLKTTNWVKYLVNDWSLNDTFQAQNGLPYTVGVSGKTTGAIANYWNGAGGSNLIPSIGMNTKKYPRRMVDDIRLQKQISFDKGRNLQLMWNVFNLANHQNVTGLNTTAYSFSGTSLNYQSTYGAVTNSNSSGFLYTPRQMEISARLNF